VQEIKRKRVNKESGNTLASYTDVMTDDERSDVIRLGGRNNNAIAFLHNLMPILQCISNLISWLCT